MRKRSARHTSSADAKKAKCDVSSSTDTSSSGREATTSISSVTTTTESDTSHERFGGASPSGTFEPEGDASHEQQEDRSTDNHSDSRDVPPPQSDGTAQTECSRLSEAFFEQVVTNPGDSHDVSSAHRRSDCAELNVWTQSGSNVRQKMQSENEGLASSQCDLLFDTMGKTAVCLTGVNVNRQTAVLQTVFKICIYDCCDNCSCWVICFIKYVSVISLRIGNGAVKIRVLY